MTSLRQRQIKKVRFGRIFIKITHHNTFINLSNVKKRVRYTASVGLLKFKGKKKTSYLARQRIGRLVAENAITRNYRILDIYFLSGFGRLYRPVLKGLISRYIIIRLLRLPRFHSHGYVRTKKMRRK